MATQLSAVEGLLGVTVPDNTRLGLANTIECGLPVSALDRLADVVSPGDSQFKFRLISRATLDRRRKSADQRLSTDESDRLARLAKVFSLAETVFGDGSKAREFLARPHLMLDGKAPLDVALATGPGADAVINLIGRAGYGGAV